jgi:hypothetical protein
MWFGIITLITAIAIAGVAAWFSIAGLMIFFGGMPMSVAIMAGTLEVGKLLTASWLYRYWNETGLLLKSYLTTAVVVLMLITSAGIYGYLSKASSDVSSDGAIATAEVERIDGLILREENKIEIIRGRITDLSEGGIDVSESIKQQEDIRDGAWARVQGDIDYNQEQINTVREQLKVDIAQQDSRLSELDKAVNDLRNKGIEVITTDEGGIFQGAETEKIDYVAQANQLRASQTDERNEIKDEKIRLRGQASADIKVFQDAVDNYRLQAQDSIKGADAEINRLRLQSGTQQDNNIAKVTDFNADIDEIFDDIAVLKDEKFSAEEKVRDIDREIGPIKYVAELLYGSSEQDIMDKAIRIFILLFVFVFDPLAVMLLIAANQTLLRYGINLESTGPEPKDPTPDPEPKNPTPEIEEVTDEDYLDPNDPEDRQEILDILNPDKLPDIEDIHIDKEFTDKLTIEIDEQLKVDWGSVDEPSTNTIVETTYEDIPSAVSDAALAIAESYAKKQDPGFHPVVVKEDEVDLGPQKIGEVSIPTKEQALEEVNEKFEETLKSLDDEQTDWVEIETHDGMRTPVVKEELTSEVKSILTPKTKKQLLEFAEYFGVLTVDPGQNKQQIINNLLASANTTVENFRTFFKPAPTNIWEKNQEKDNASTDATNWDASKAKPDDNEYQGSKFTIKK